MGLVFFCDAIRKFTQNDAEYFPCKRIHRTELQEDTKGFYTAQFLLAGKAPTRGFSFLFLLVPLALS